MRGTLRRNIVSALLLMVFIVAKAQTNGNDSTHFISEVEVKGVSLNKDLRSLFPQYTVSSADFLRLNISDISSALRRLPGVTLRDYGGAGGMKTVSVRGLGSQHTGVALDGMLLADTQSGQIDLQQFQLAEISSLSLLGDGDIFQPARNFSRASMLSITTADTLSNSLSLETGSWGYLSPSARLHHNLNKVSLSFQGGYTRADNDYPFTVENGVDTHREKRANSRLSQGNINCSALWQIAPESNLKSFVRLFDDDRQLPGVVRLYTNENDETLRDRGLVAQTMLTSRLAKRFWIKSGLRWNWTEQAYHNGLPSGGIKSERYINREYYATSALLFQPLEGLDFDYSIDYFNNTMTTTLASNPNPKRNSLLQSLAGKWTNKYFALMALVLNSHIDDENHWSPSVSASYKPFMNHDLRLRVSAKDIFRMPTMTELYYCHIGTANLKPEKTKQLNLGVTLDKMLLANNLHTTLACDIYINKVEDKIVAMPFNMFVWRYMNVASVVGRGLDLSASVAYSMGDYGSLSLSTNYSYQRIGMRNVLVEKYEDNQIAYTPEHSGSTTLAWINRWCNLSATLTGASEQWTNNEHNGKAIKGYREMAFSAYKEINLNAGQQLELRAVVQNLFAREYELVANYPMPGRNIKVSITYKI